MREGGKEGGVCLCVCVCLCVFDMRENLGKKDCVCRKREGGREGREGGREGGSVCVCKEREREREREKEKTERVSFKKKTHGSKHRT